MPLLTWSSKSHPHPHQVELKLDSIIYPHGAGFPSMEYKDSLFLGDNLAIMAALLPRYQGKLDLIYADPPFFTNKKFPARIGRGEDSRRPADWQLAEGYTDSWRDLDAYLDFLYPRLVLMHQLLSPTGMLYLHLDWHANAYARILLDEIFGYGNLVNEIAWIYHGPSPIRRAFNRKHDVILACAKGKEYIFNTDAVREPYHPSTIRTFNSSAKAGFGKVPNLLRGKVPEDWWYFPVVARLHKERTGYPTQKPEALLERILLASSNPGSLVADFFCGSGTFPLVAARHGRHFLASDISWRAVHTTRSRLVDQAHEPFSIYLSLPGNFSSQKTSFSYSLDDDRSTVNLSAPGLEIDYWEVDPDWDGQVFHSVAQVRRSNHSSDIPFKIKLPLAATKVCLRVVTIDGEQIELD
jgi:DNA modification methylase